MEKIFKFIQKNLFFLILLSIFSGILFARFLGGFEFSVLVCIFAALTMIYPSLVSLDFSKLKDIYKHKNIIIISILLNFVMIPLIGFLVGYLFLRDYPVLFLGLFLLSILPGGGMVVSWAQKTKSDLVVTVGIIVANLLTAVVLVPIFLSFFINTFVGNINTQIGQPKFDNFYQGIQATNHTGGCLISKATNNTLSCSFGNSHSIRAVQIAIPILIIVLIPLGLAFTTQKILKKILQENKFEKSKIIFSGISNIGMFFTLFFLMGMKQNIIIFEKPDLLLKSIIPVIIFYATILSINLFIFKKNKTAETKALIWGNYLRYITLALGFSTSLIYQNQVYSQIIIVIVLSYLVQIPISFWLPNKLSINKTNE